MWEEAGGLDKMKKPGSEGARGGGCSEVTDKAAVVKIKPDK